MSYKITQIKARQILDSRGNPTVETTVYAGNDFATASVPSGASTGSYEARELRDSTKSFNGLSVNKAIANIQTKIARQLKGMDVRQQEDIDRVLIKLDGTPNKSKLGANAILSVSLAAARLAAKQTNQELFKYLRSLTGLPLRDWQLPTPLFNVINGGLHANSGLDIQELFVIPKRGKFAAKLETAWVIIQRLKTDLQKKGWSTSVGDEGGFAPQFNSNEKALRFLRQVVQNSGYKLGSQVSLGIDAAASEFFDKDKQVYRLVADSKHYKPISIYKLYQRWVKSYHLEVIEDGCAEDDMIGWQNLTRCFAGTNVDVVGDDLFVTQLPRLQAGIIAGLGNSILIKPNQVGTLTESLQAISLAKKYGYKVVVSHRSGETNDDFIADLAVAVNADYIKAGSLARGERLAKYNRLLQIAELLGK